MKPDKGLRQNFFTATLSQGHVYAKNTSKDRVNTSNSKKLKTNSSVKHFGGNIGQNQINKVRVSSGGRAKPGTSNVQEKHLKYLLHDSDKTKRKSGGGSHSRNPVYQINTGSQTGRSYNKSGTREYSPQNISSKSPRNAVKKSRNNRMGGSQTQVTTKRRQSKKYSRDEAAFKTVKAADKSKKDSIFLMYQQYPRMTKTGQVPVQQPRTQFSALSPKTGKASLKIAQSIHDKMKANNKHGGIRGSSDPKVTSYLNSLASDNSRSKEDLRYVPVENISLFDGQEAPMSARNPRTSSMNNQQYTNISSALRTIPFFRNFEAIKVFKAWEAYTRRQKYLRKREELANKLPFTKPFFMNLIPGIIEPLNEIRYFSPLVEVKQKNVYTKKSDGYQGFIIQCSNKQKQTMARIGNLFFKVLRNIDKLCKVKQTMLKPNKKWKYERETAVELIEKAISY